MGKADRQKWKSEIKRMTLRRIGLTISNIGRKFSIAMTWLGRTPEHRRPLRRNAIAYAAAILSRAKGITHALDVRRLINASANLGIL
jgi:hypothetical protein